MRGMYPRCLSSCVFLIRACSTVGSRIRWSTFLPHDDDGALAHEASPMATKCVLKCKIVVLKVSLHCTRCEDEVRKILRKEEGSKLPSSKSSPNSNFYSIISLKIEAFVNCDWRIGVYTVEVDSKSGKVTVMGNADAKTLIRRLQKAGKIAELWPEKERPAVTSHPPKSDIPRVESKGRTKSSPDFPPPSPPPPAMKEGEEIILPQLI
ncbi:hypothetical protein KSP40_PGU011280 [Platanthera guangdongensis]|uniref:HMA domain-containing protein n=1 Tax=Platanthera guangdongensis TaxID=2320717 RepID=A0ABR2MBG8_9ASPA